MLSPSDDRTTPSLHISLSDDSDHDTPGPGPIFAKDLVSSPTAAYTRRPHHHGLRGYSDSTESTEILGSGDFSRLTRDMTLVAGSSFDHSTGFSHEGTTVSGPTCVGTPVLSPIDVYPVAPEFFTRHEKRRKM